MRLLHHLYIVSFILTPPVRSLFGTPTQFTKTLSARAGKVPGSIVLYDGFCSDCIARAYLNERRFKDGFQYLYVETLTDDDDLSAYAAGALEGELTRHEITETIGNTHFEERCLNQNICDRLSQFFAEQTKYMYRRIRKDTKSEFWYHVKLILHQLAGLQDSYHKMPLVVKEFVPNVKEVGFLSVRHTIIEELQRSNYTRDGMIKFFNFTYNINEEGVGLVTFDGNEVMVGHSATNFYYFLDRVLKRYVFRFQRGPNDFDKHVPATNLSFASTPGVLYSPDTFIVSDTNIVQMATYMKNYMLPLNPEFNVNSVPGWIRSMVASRLSSTGKELIDTFAQEHSGLACTLTLAIDFNWSKDSKDPQSGLIYLAEEAPNRITVKDITKVLQKQKHIVIRYIPFTTETYNRLGFNLKHHDALYSQVMNSVSRYLRRVLTKQSLSLEEFKKLIRHNGWALSEPEAFCDVCDWGGNSRVSSILTIAPRYDLLDELGDDLYLREPFGVVNTKVITAREARHGVYHAIHGPPYDEKRNPPMRALDLSKDFKDTFEWHGTFYPERYKAFGIYDWGRLLDLVDRNTYGGAPIIEKRKRSSSNKNIRKSKKNR